MNEISIHALREEGDRFRFFIPLVHHNFYPRPPRGGRPFVDKEFSAVWIFLSTPSARRATGWTSLSQGPSIFLSTPSARRATFLGTLVPLAALISIHALREEGDAENHENHNG